MFTRYLLLTFIKLPLHEPPPTLLIVSCMHHLLSLFPHTAALNILKTMSELLVLYFPSELFYDQGSFITLNHVL